MSDPLPAMSIVAPALMDGHGLRILYCGGTNGAHASLHGSPSLVSNRPTARTVEQSCFTRHAEIDRCRPRPLCESDRYLSCCVGK
jgi:hypothetical protein